MAAPFPAGKAKKVTSMAGQAPIEAAPAESRLTSPKLPRAGVRVTLRIPIAMKFTVFIAILVVAFMLWQTITAIRVAESRLDKEINESGVVLVSALATLIDPSWVRNFDFQQKLVSTLRSFVESPGPVRAQIRNVVVYDSQGNAIATARAESRFQRTMATTVKSDEAAEAMVTILEFSYDGEPVRSFSRPILAQPEPRKPESQEPAASEGAAAGASGGPVHAGQIEVYISAVEIEDSRQELSNAMIAVSTTACLVAGVGAFVLARFLTRPIRALLKDIRQVSQGDLQHQAKVRSSDELGDLARAFNVMTSSLQAAQETKLAQQALEQELSIATQIQTRLLPSSIPQVKAFDIAAYYVSAKEVGGDYYDFLPVDEDHLGIVVADVSGKSVPGSLIMTMTRSLLRLAAERESSPARAVQIVNRFLTPDVNPGMFVTLLYVVLNLKNREAKLVRCGHNAPLLYSVRHEKVLRLQPRGIALCLDREGALFQSELQVQRFLVTPGDVLVCFTDGVIEAKSRSGKDYTEEKLSLVLSANAGGSAREVVEAVVKDLSQHQRGTQQSDDITLLVLKGQ